MIAILQRFEDRFEAVCGGAGHVLFTLLRALGAVPRLRRRRQDLLAQTHQATFGSMAVVLVIAFFIGMIVAIQTGAYLRQLGQEAALGYIVAAGMVREMGPVFTALALAGLVGSTYAAELGTMKVSEEIDALEVMSIDPIYFLVMPRVLALTLSGVILTIYADLVGTLGGALVSSAIFRVDMSTYFNNASDILEFKDLWGGLVKSAIFAATVASIACSQGLRAQHGAQGVGHATMRSVVFSMIFILVFDYILSWLLLP